MMPYTTQWEIKKKSVLDVLNRRGFNFTQFNDEFPAKRIWNYRNRIQLHGENGQLGFYKPGSKDIVDIDQCPIARKEINEILPKVKADLINQEMAYNVELEVHPDTQITISENAPYSVYGFRQVHDDQNLVLQKWVALQLENTGVLWDLYGGDGNLSLDLSRRGTQVHCVDKVPLSDEQKNNKPQFFKHYKMNIVDWLKKKAHECTVPGLQHSAIVDPPRDGLGGLVKLLNDVFVKADIQKMILIGCDTDAWCRDLLNLKKAGWELSKIAILDFFPQTRHVESLGVLIRK